MSTPTDEEARGLAARWAWWQKHDADARKRLEVRERWLTPAERERLESWVLERTPRCTWVEAAQAVQRATGISEDAARALVAAARRAS
jgi:hypothetical protein